MSAHTIELSITPLCTACGEPLKVGNLMADPEAGRFESPRRKTDQKLFVYACEQCFVYSKDSELLKEALDKLDSQR